MDRLLSLDVDLDVGLEDELLVDIIECLENKICSGDYSDEEYDLYIEYKEYGIRAFNSRGYASVLSALVRELDRYCCEY